MSDIINIMRTINDATLSASLAASQEARQGLAREIMAAINRPRAIDPQWVAAAIVEDIRQICARQT